MGDGRFISDVRLYGQNNQKEDDNVYECRSLVVQKVELEGIEASVIYRTQSRAQSKLKADNKVTTASQKNSRI